METTTTVLRNTIARNIIRYGDLSEDDINNISKASIIICGYLRDESNKMDINIPNDLLMFFSAWYHQNEQKILENATIYARKEKQRIMKLALDRKFAAYNPEICNTELLEPFASQY